MVIQLSDNFQENLNNFSKLTKQDVSSDFFQTPFFRRLFISQDLKNLVSFYMISNYISNINFLTSIWSEITYDYFQNHQEVLTRFDLYSGNNDNGVKTWMRDNMSYATFLHMISHFYSKEGFQRTLEIYTDTVTQLGKILSRYQNMNKEISRPKKWRLEEFHNHMSNLYLESTVTNKKHPVEFISAPVKKDNWKIYQPKDTLDLAMWGRSVRNCVLSYEDAIFSKKSAIFLIEENDKPTYTVELDYKELKKGRVSFRQIVGLTNRSSDLDSEKKNIVANLIESVIQK